MPSNGAELTIRELSAAQAPWRIRATDDQERHAARLQECCATADIGVAMRSTSTTKCVSAARRYAATYIVATKPPAS
jgi:hypothetical protein